MQRYFVLVAVFLCSAIFSAYAQPAKKPVAAAKAAEVKEYPALMEQAKKMAATIQDEDYEAFVEVLHPRALKIFGTKEKAVAVLKQVAANSKSSGVEPKSYEVKEPTQTLTYKKTIYAVLPSVFKGLVNGKESTVLSTVLAASEDGGETWKFMRIESKAVLRQMFPEVAARLKIPDSKIL